MTTRMAATAMPANFNALIITFQTGEVPEHRDQSRSGPPGAGLRAYPGRQGRSKGLINNRWCWN
jgi:hypothetical protein